MYRVIALTLRLVENDMTLNGRLQVVYVYGLILAEQQTDFRALASTTKPQHALSLCNNVR